MKPGRCLTEQPGVKAPGTLKRTTFLVAHSVGGVLMMGFIGDKRRVCDGRWAMGDDEGGVIGYRLFEGRGDQPLLAL